MNFRTFAARNVLRNGRAYLAYFLSTAVSAALFFSLSLFIFHPDKGKFKSYIETSLLGAETVTYFFLFFFVFYSISVFLKSRYKEFGILYLLGTSKAQMMRMIFLENMIISAAAAGSGIVTGLVFSKLFLLVVEKLLRISSLPFYFPGKAIGITLASFMLLGACISVFASSIIREKNVLKLIKGTVTPRRAPAASKIGAVLGAALLAGGYGLSFAADKSSLDKMILPIIGMVILATYLLFAQFSVFFVAALKKNRPFYRRGVNLIWVSNLLYRIKDNTRMFFIIAITSAAAFIAIGTCYAFWSNTASDIERKYPYAFTYRNFGDASSAAGEIRFIEDRLKARRLAYEKIAVQTKNAGSADGASYTLMKASVYSRLAVYLRLKPASIEGNQAWRVTVSGDGGASRIPVGGANLAVTNEIRGTLLPDQYAAIYVVADSLFDRVNDSEPANPLYIFAAKDWQNTFSVYDDYSARYGGDSSSLFLSKSHVYETEKRAYGTIMFLSIFIGVLFFVTSGSFMYNKFFADAETDKRKYRQLHKIGVTYGEIRKAVTRETGILFLLPFLVAAVHAAVALYALQSIFRIQVGAAACLVTGSFLILQVLYYAFIRRNYLEEIRKQLAAD
ncbi:FtsX-like permease family protein [Paenibacillus humicola]|uniref:FtsX-like permease family protein n=1 Tax=Paenibacillus humicola TaxID=3110540 RepID=UPI00237C0071|nr:ABC transporter permease [Paenibacillus humicola]